MQDLLSRVLQLVRIKDSAPTLVITRPALHLPQVLMGREEGFFTSPMLTKKLPLSHAHKFRADAPTTLLTGLTLLCLSGEVTGPALLSVAAITHPGQISCSYDHRDSSLTSLEISSCGGRKAALLIHATTRQMGNGGKSPMLTVSGLAPPLLC